MLEARSSAAAETSTRFCLGMDGMDMDGIDLSEIFMSMGLGGGLGGLDGLGGGFGSSRGSRRSHGAIRAGEMVALHGLNKAKDSCSDSTTPSFSRLGLFHPRFSHDFAAKGLF